MMNNIELEAVRRFLFLSVPEAARMVSRTSEAAWRKWESGQNPVPKDVQATLQAMLDYREGVVDMHDEMLGKVLGDEDEPAQIVLIWYDNIDDFLTAFDDPRFWRPYCSAIAEMKGCYDAVRLVKFNQASYRNWLGGKSDDAVMRTKWAASQAF